jgi:photosystem II stability/assembly factor-like uncharacterized protein
MPNRPLFIAAGQQGARIASADGGKTWQPQQVGKEGEVYRAVAFGNGRFVAVGSFGGKNIIAATADGAKWDLTTKDGQYRFFIRGLGFGGNATPDAKGFFLGIGGDPGSVGGSAPFVVTSTDGATWSDFTPIAGKHILRRIAWGGQGGGRFVGVGDRGRRATSKDGKTWEDPPNTKAIDTLVDVAYGGAEGKGLFVGVGLHGLRMTSPDGLKWSDRIPGEEGEHLNSVVWTGDRFVAVGAGATYLSPDGVKWERRPNKDAPTAVAHGKIAGEDVFVGASYKGRLLRSPDGVAWEQTYKGEHHFEAVAFGE